MKNIILVLGAPNDEKGNLSKIAIDRLETAYHLYKHHKNFKFLCTGGFGTHFNTTNLPHAYYAKAYLLKKGVNELDIMNLLPTTNTVDDFRMAVPILENENPAIILIVTSDFHISRAKIIYDIITENKEINIKSVFISAKSSLSKEELSFLKEHEKRAIEILTNNGFKLY